MVNYIKIWIWNNIIMKKGMIGFRDFVDDYVNDHECESLSGKFPDASLWTDLD